MRLIEPDVFFDGIDLVNAYVAAVRARVEFVPAPSPCVMVDVDARSMRIDTRPFEPTAELMLAQLHLLRCEEETAHDDLWTHIDLHGPVETGSGVWRLDGDERMTYRRHDHPVIPIHGRAPCNN